MSSRNTNRALLLTKAKLFKRAAELGASNAYAGIANMYETGKGVDKNVNKAYEFYMKGAEHDSHLSYMHLGIIFMKGVVVQRDYRQARLWFQKAVDAGNPQSKEYPDLLKGV